MPITIAGIDLYNVREIAEMLGVSTRTVHSYIVKGRIKGRKIGGGWRFTEENLREYLTGADKPVTFKKGSKNPKQPVKQTAEKPNDP